MAGETRQPLTCVFYLIDRETGETKRIDKVPPEALEKMSKIGRASCRERV